MYRNVAGQKITVFAFDTSTGAAKTGDAANLTLYVQKDGGTLTALTDTSATEVDATNGKGLYQFDVSQAETDAVVLDFAGKSTTANIQIVPVKIKTEPNYFTSMAIDSSGRVDVGKVGGTAQTARDLGASVLLSSGTGTGQISLSSGAVRLQPTQTGVTIPTVTNLTNAPTNGDLTATMKTSVTTAATAATPTAAAVTGAVGSVTGNVGGNVVGTVKLDATQSAYAPAKAGDAMTLTSGERTSIAAAVWNALTSGMSTAGSIGKKLADWVVGTIDTYTGNTKQTGDAFARLGAPAGASVSADIAAVALSSATSENVLSDPDFGLVAVKTETAASKTILDRLNGMIVIDGAVYQFTANALELSPAGGSAPTASQVADAVWDEALSGHATSGTAGAALATAGAGGISPELQAMIENTYAGVTALQGVSITLASPMGQGGNISILWGYDYYSADGTVPTWIGTNWPNLTGASLGIVDFDSHASLGGTVTGVSVGGATQTVKWEIPDATFTSASSGKYILEATLSGGNKVPLAIGQLLRQ